MKVNPFNSKAENYTQMFNEGIILGISVIIIFLTSASNPGKVRDAASWAIISGFSIIALTNIGFILFQKL
jgi:hypothetical protein